MMPSTFCSVCLSTAPCEGDVIMRLWGACATAVRPTDRAGPTPWTPPCAEGQSPRSALLAALHGAAESQAV